MTDWDNIEATIERGSSTPTDLLQACEQVLENWIEARTQQPTKREREGFRLLALHRQGAMGDPSFNACRETCREVAYHYNLLAEGGPKQGSAPTLAMMQIVANHLMLFVRGKMEVAGLGEFCCSSKSLRAMDTDHLVSDARA